GQTNCVPLPANAGACGDIFVRDRSKNITERVSVSSEGVEGDADSGSPRISPEGRYVGFISSAANLVEGDANDHSDVFLHDRETNITERVSVSSAGAQPDDWSVSPPGVSEGGRWVAFQSRATNLVPGDTNGPGLAGEDVFVRDRGPDLGFGDLTVSRRQDGSSVSGWVTFPAAIVSSATDADDDADIGPADGRRLAAELLGATVTYRPEREDLLLRTHLANDGEAPPSAGALHGAAMVFGFDFTVGGTAWSVRGERPSGTQTAPAAARFTLWRCDPTCSEVGTLPGSLGTTASEALVAVPLGSIGAFEGAPLSDLRAFTSLATAATGAPTEVDLVALPSGAIPRRTLSLGVAPPGTAEEDVVTDQAIPVLEGRFTATIHQPSGEGQAVWARACLGMRCEVASRRLDR
ncbi:MAG TPA: hypothetical protein VM638_07700, partial [Actinomycetota bacterium]|nr:hypothetical protein [Actinomycetota bacterium]